MTDLLQEIQDALVAGDPDRVTELVQTGLTQGVPPEILLDQALIPGVKTVGELFSRYELYLPDMLLAGMALGSTLPLLRPLLVGATTASRGVVVIGTVKDDLHDIGKNLVATMLEGAGFDVIDLGIDVPAERFVEAAVEHNASIVAMSCLLTTTLPSMQQAVRAIDNAGLRNRVKILVGGAPVTREYALGVGADGYAENAAAAVQEAELLQCACDAVPNF